ncbi:hypothetical protein ACWPKO_27340 (plasmid) [Coraliomargarita sp. W4R53]
MTSVVGVLERQSRTSTIAGWPPASAGIASFPRDPQRSSRGVAARVVTWRKWARPVYWGITQDAYVPWREWVAGSAAVIPGVLSDQVSAAISLMMVLAMCATGALIARLILKYCGRVALAAVCVFFVLMTSMAAWSEAGSDLIKVGGYHSLERGVAGAPSYASLLVDLADQDAQGGAAKTQIRVVAIRDDLGAVISWRVQLPSTQLWQLNATSGALNDLRADLLMSVLPSIDTQLEEAAWLAMTDAGLFKSDAPIMFAGWSLGGMMAAELAADPRVADRVASVFTAGSAIDKQYSEVPAATRVTQLNNALDPVHTLEFVGLDLADYARGGDNWQTYRPIAWPMHSLDMYVTAAESSLPQLRPGDEIFFGERDGKNHEDVYVAEFAQAG